MNAGVFPMTIRHLKIFITVYENESVTSAAEALHMTQPTVTRAIQELESFYGVTLFERLHRRLYVTEAGRRLYQQAYHVVTQMDQMKTDMEDWGESGLVHIGAGTTLGSTLLPLILNEFTEKHPRLQVHLMVSDRGKLEDELLHNQLDIALLESGPIDAELEKQQIGRDRMVVILPVAHPLLEKKTLTVEDLSEVPVLTSEKGAASRTFIEHLFSLHSLPLTPVMESDSIHALIHAVHAGLGVALLPENLVADSVRHGLVASRGLKGEKLTRRNYVVWHRSRYMSQALQDFIEISCRLGAQHLTATEN